MNLKTYKPTHPEAAEFLKQIDEFLDTVKDGSWLIGSAVRIHYYHDKTAANCTEPSPYDPPESIYSKGLMMLRNFHKLWRVDFKIKDLWMDMYDTDLGQKVGWEVIFGIGGDLSVRCPSDNIAEYKLVLDDVTMMFTYKFGEMRDIEEKDGERKAISVYADLVTISVSKNG